MINYTVHCFQQNITVIQFFFYFFIGPIDGQWGSWESWETCINPNPDPWDIHGIGIRIRRRYCDDNAPTCGGADCIGSDTDLENCTGIKDIKYFVKNETNNIKTIRYFPVR